MRCNFVKYQNTRFWYICKIYQILVFVKYHIFDMCNMSHIYNV